MQRIHRAQLWQTVCRRHLSSSQKAVIALDILPMLEAEAHERKRIGAENRHNNSQDVEQVPHPGRESGKARDAVAKITGTNPRYVSDAKKLSAEAPDLLDDVRTGNKSITLAKRELKERDREQVRQANRELVNNTMPLAETAPVARYQTVVLDPPWDWGDEGDCDQYGRARPTYATMSLSEIMALPINDLIQPNAHIYLWITNRSLPKGFDILEQWGFRYITVITWVKPSFGMGNYFRGSTEHILFGVRGSLPLLRKNAPTHLYADRPGKHSGKPDEFYDMVQTCSPGPWLEMFSRKPRNGWVAWGAEANG